jgi:hypothetical protein
MRASIPPALATWLLQHLRFSNTDDALVGDLMEEFSQRRSAAWYWRQVLLAVLVGFEKEVRIHWVLAVRAAMIGLAVSTGATVLLHFLIVTLHQNAVIDVSSSPRFVPWFLTSFMSGAIGGWLVAFLYPKHRAAMLVSFAAALLIWASMGRGVIRLQPGSQRFVTYLTDYVFVLAGVVAGFAFSRAPNTGARSRQIPGLPR